MSETAQRAMAQGLTDQLMKTRELAAQARSEARHFKELSEEALDGLDAAAAQIESERKLAIAAAAGAAVVAGMLGGALGVSMARRQQAMALARVSQEMVDLRRRGVAELEKAQRFGGEGLARSLIPALDAMDALEASVSSSGSDDAEGTRLTRTALLDALREHDVDCIDLISGPLRGSTHTALPSPL